MLRRRQPVRPTLTNRNGEIYATVEPTLWGLAVVAGIGALDGWLTEVTGFPRRYVQGGVSRDSPRQPLTAKALRPSVERTIHDSSSV